jgi:hypothetical protein
MLGYHAIVMHCLVCVGLSFCAVCGYLYSSYTFFSFIQNSATTACLVDFV